MADTGTVVETHTVKGGIHILSFAWISDGSGDVLHEVLADNPNGLYFQCDTNPGTAAPTADYDISFLNEDSVDIFGTSLDDRHTSTSEIVSLTVPVAISGTPTFQVDNAGAAKTGVAKFYFKKAPE